MSNDTFNKPYSYIDKYALGFFWYLKWCSIIKAAHRIHKHETTEIINIKHEISLKETLRIWCELTKANEFQVKLATLSLIPFGVSTSGVGIDVKWHECLGCPLVSWQRAASLGCSLNHVEDCCGFHRFNSDLSMLCYEVSSIFLKVSPNN